MSNLQRGADIPVRHSEGNGYPECNGGLENPPSGIQNKQCFNSGEVATISSQAGLNIINKGLGATDRVTGRFISCLQKYRLTEKGRKLLEQLHKEGGLS